MSGREVAVFIDGSAIAAHRHQVKQQPDFQRIVGVIEEELNARVVETRFYALETREGSQGLWQFWEALERMGINLIRVASYKRELTCRRCECPNEAEFNVAPWRMTDDILRGAVENRYDMAAVVSGRLNAATVVQAATRMDHPSYGVFWQRSRLNEGLDKVLKDRFVNLDDFNVYRNHHNRRLERRGEW